MFTKQDYFEADIERSQTFTSDAIKVQNVMSSVSHVIYHKFSHGAAFYTFNGKNVNAMIEFFFRHQCYIDNSNSPFLLQKQAQKV